MKADKVPETKVSLRRPRPVLGAHKALSAWSRSPELSSSWQHEPLSFDSDTDELMIHS